MRFISSVRPGGLIQFTFEGERIQAFTGESIASALLRTEHPAQRRSRRTGEFRGYYCGMGLCWECAVMVEGQGVVRSCSYLVQPGLLVTMADGKQS